jgi:hypothetical protein
MFEFVSFAFSAAIGTIIWRYAHHRTRLILAAIAAIALGFTATIISGEYAISWVFVLEDVASSSAAVAIGAALVGVFRHGTRFER